MDKENVEGIRRWRLEGGSRKRASYSEILERHWRHTLQAKPPRGGKTTERRQDHQEEAKL
jgi:hypothetical protein